MNCYKEEKNPIAEVEYANAMYKQQSLVVEKETYTKNLMFAEYVRKCRVCKNTYDFLQDTIAKAFHEFNSKERISMNKTPSLYTMQSCIRKDFFESSKEAKITKIIQCGLDAYGYDFEIKFKNFIFEIYFPIIEHLNVSNIEYANAGKIVVYIQKDKNYRSFLGSSYRIEDIASTIKKYIEENEKERV